MMGEFTLGTNRGRNEVGKDCIKAHTMFNSLVKAAKAGKQASKLID
jgi:hypothetical protein